MPQTEGLAQQKAHSRRGVDRLVEIIAHNGIIPAADTAYANTAITTGEDEGKGFYPSARILVPDLKHVSSIVIAAALKEQWQCKMWKSGYRRGLAFPPLAELRHRFNARHGPQDWPEITEWESSSE